MIGGRDRLSVSETVALLGGAAVTCARRKKRCVTLSTTETEYVALGDGAKGALFTGAVLKFVVPGLCESRIRVLEDNEGVMAVAENPLSSARSKCIDMRFQFVHELLRGHEIGIEYVPTKSYTLIYRRRRLRQLL